MSGKVLKVIKVDENGAQTMDINSPAQLHDVLAKALGEEADIIERPHPMDNPAFLQMLQEIEKTTLTRLLGAPEDVIKRVCSGYESMAQKVGLTKEEQAAIKDFTKDLEQKLLAQNEDLDEAFNLSFTEEQAVNHMAELLKLKPGDHVQFFKKDLAVTDGFFLGIALGKNEPNGVNFLCHKNGKIVRGIAPFYCVFTTVTADLVEKLRTWKESKPDFVKE